LLNGKQNSIFRPLVEKAWLVHCQRHGYAPTDKASRDSWYRAELLHRSGLAIYTTKQIDGSDADAVDKLLMHFAIAAQDERMIGWVNSSAERRARWRLEHTMQNAGVGWPYINAIARNMGYGDLPLEELPAEIVLKINTAVYLYWRRKQKKQKEPENVAVCAN
jgi:hypothetical protein